jgi:hypothetical protein
MSAFRCRADSSSRFNVSRDPGRGIRDQVPAGMICNTASMQRVQLRVRPGRNPARDRSSGCRARHEDLNLPGTNKIESFEKHITRTVQLSGVSIVHYSGNSNERHAGRVKGYLRSTCRNPFSGPLVVLFRRSWHTMSGRTSSDRNEGVRPTPTRGMHLCASFGASAKACCCTESVHHSSSDQADVSYGHRSARGALKPAYLQSPGLIIRANTDTLVYSETVHEHHHQDTRY